MQARKLDATAALQRLRTAHEPAWVGPALHEQLVLFRLCHFGPTPGVPVYDGWRAQMLAAGRR
jgi:dual specificity phosphatase 12